MLTLAPAGRLLTVEDYRALPEDGKRYELVDGELFMSPAPNEFHQKVSWRLTIIIGNFLDAHGEGEAFAAPFDVFLDEFNALQPDLLFLGSDQVEQLDGGLHGVPDLAVEILSPTNARHDLFRKRDLYHRFRVKELWIVDPIAKTITVDRLGADGYEPEISFNLGDTLTTPLLPGLQIPLAQVFDYPWVKRSGS